MLSQFLWTWHTSLSDSITASSGKRLSREDGASRTISACWSLSVSLSQTTCFSKHSTRKQKHIQWADFMKVKKQMKQNLPKPLGFFFLPIRKHSCHILNAQGFFPFCTRSPRSNPLRIWPESPTCVKSLFHPHTCGFVDEYWLLLS